MKLTDIRTAETGVRELLPCIEAIHDTAAHLGVYLSTPPPPSRRSKGKRLFWFRVTAKLPWTPGLQACMPFLASRRTPWHASPAPDPHREEGVPQCFPWQKKNPNPTSLLIQSSPTPRHGPVTQSDTPAPLSCPTPTIITGFIRV